MYYEYEVISEKQRGPFGLIKERVSVGKVTAEQPQDYTIGASKINLFLDRHDVLRIYAQGQPVRVEFAAEPYRFEYKVVTRLDTTEPEIATCRRKVTLYQELDPKQRLILEAPKFWPLVIPEQHVKEYANFMRRTGGRMAFVQ